LTKEDLKKMFKIAKTYNSDICIELTIPGREAHEFTIVLNANLDYCLDDYKNNYNENLELNTDINKIIVNAFGFVFGKQNR